MTLAERRKQVAKDRHEVSPMRGYMDAPERTAKGAPPGRPDSEHVERGPAAGKGAASKRLAAAPGNPVSVSAWATAYPGMLSIGGQVKLPQRGSTYTGMWLYVLDEAGYPVVQQEINRSTDDPSGDTPDTGAWCYDWWSSNSYPTDQCFWWAGSELDGILEDGKKYYAWVFLSNADGSSPGGTTSLLVEAFYTPGIPGAAAGICTCYAQAHRADPVNTATGMFYEQLTDASLTGPGVPLTLERTYRSDSSSTGLLGRGWATPFDARLTLATGKATYRTGDGASFVFTQAANGTYTAPAGTTAELVKGTSTYTVTTPDHTVRTFDSTGLLTSVTGAAGKGLSLTYASGSLASVKDGAGRTTSFTPGADGLLSEVALPDGTSVSYGYTGGLLTSVTDPAGRTSSYTYDTDKRLSSYTDPAGGEVGNVYDSAGRITSQTDQNGETTTFTWDGRSESHTTAPDGGVWTDVYASNVLMETIDPYGNSITYDYDRYLRPAAITDQRGNTTEMTYDSAGRMLTRAAPAALGYEESWGYDSAGNLTSHTDGRGNTTTYAYTANRLTSATDPTGGETAYTYTALGSLETVTSPRGKVTTYGYDTAGNRTSVTTPLGERTTFTYDPAGRVLTRTDPRGNVTGADPAAYTTTYTYDGRGLLSSATDALGRTTTYEYNGAEQLASVLNPAGDTATLGYDDAGNLTRTTDQAGESLTRAYDTGGRLASRTDAAGGRTTFTYDKAGRLLSSVSPRGNVSGADPAAYTTSYAYDTAGNLTETTGPTGATTKTTYDAVNRPLVVTDPLGRTTGYTYDANNNVTRTTDAAGETTTAVYDKNNRLSSSTDELGRTTAYAYDADGNLLSRTSPLGHRASWTYDDDGRRATAVDPRGNATGADPAQYTTTYGYDPAGHPTEVTDPLGGTTTTAYDATGKVVEREDADGRTTSYGYDDLDRLTEVTAPGGAVTTYGYDQLGNLTERTDANDHVTAYGYDAVHRLTSVTDPLDRETAYAYDAEGHVTGKTTPRGTTGYTYDPRGLLTAIDYSDTTPDASFGYDDAGQLTARANSEVVEDFVYDEVGNLSSTRGFAYTYDAAGQMLTREYADGSTFAYTYDADGRTATMDADGATTTYTWDPAGNLTASALPDSATENRTYDRAGRITAVTATRAGTTVTGTALTLSAAGLPSRVDVTREGVGTGGYDLTYDAAGRLTSGCAPQPEVTGCAAGRTTSYTYDEVGNRLTSTLGTASTGYAYDAADQLTSTTTGTTTTAYDHDAEGNRTKAGADTYSYDLAGQISAATVGGASYTYGHDASGNQVTTAEDGAVTSRTQWDPNAPLPVLATEYDSGWAVEQSYRYDPLGQPAATATGTEEVFYYHHDTQGSPVDVTGSTGTLHQRWAYDSFGTRTLDTTAAGAPASTPSYTGARYETSTGNLDLHARQYDTTTGRFTRSDPAARDLSTPYVSAYAYADNAPSALTDPSGLSPDDPDNDRVDSFGEALGIFGDAFVDVAKSPFVFLGDLHDAFTGKNGGAGAFIDKYLPVRPAYRLYRAEYMLRQQGCDALADLYAETADELAQQLVLTGVGGLTGWRRTAVATERELQSGGSSFRRPRSEMDFELEWADHAYDAIRADAQLGRVAQTAASHGYSAADINQIYNHLFTESHQLDAGMLRFDANPRIARAWERLQNGNPHPSDFDLLAHELYESSWMRQHGDQNYRRAHQATLDAGHTWDEHAPAADGIGYR
ncbi:RHS repeat protein [Streptomyces sp. SID4913]|nr:RHS repeat protein [Streptomyces sp. SID4913]